jgi:hypothetical protein
MSHFDLGAFMRTAGPRTRSTPGPSRYPSPVRHHRGTSPRTNTGPALPGVVEEIAEVIGHERALYLIGQLPRCEGGGRAYPGKRASQVVLYVPKPHRLGPTHELVRILGQDDAMALCEAFGGELLKPANCDAIRLAFRNTSLVEMAAAGVSDTELAEIFGLTRRRVLMLRTPKH